MKTDEFETMFDNAFRESVKLTRLVPHAEESWMRLQKKLARKQNSRRRHAILKVLPYAITSFLLGAILFGTPTVSNAFQQVATAIKHDVLSILFNNKPSPPHTIPKTAPPSNSNRVLYPAPYNSQKKISDTFPNHNEH